jgi:hypothetical protein
VGVIGVLFGIRPADIRVLLAMKNIPAGNKVYLTCSGCGIKPLELGRRGTVQYGKCPSARDFEEWFEHHSKCFGPPDKWKLGYHFTPNHDQPTAVAEAVKSQVMQ